jgi:hypothetical protein
MFEENETIFFFQHHIPSEYFCAVRLANFISLVAGHKYLHAVAYLEFNFDRGEGGGEKKLF